LEHVDEALEHIGFVGANITAAHEAFEEVQMAVTVGTATVEHPTIPHGYVPGLIEGNTGEKPRIKTGDWATQEPEYQPRRLVPPCNHICPAGNDVQGFLAALAKDDADEALKILLRTSPFPSVCGRVCPAPCMDACNRIQLDGAVNVRDLERWAGDHGTAEAETRPPRSEHIAVIGSGPAGLAAIYHLKLLGYQVTLHEGGPEIGGLLRTGIPAYRLPREALDREIDRILELGVTVVTNHRVDKKELLELARTHDAVLVATGLQQLRDLKLGA
ncbi:MAG: NAD(P)-binding protein, partial [bacterium]|nr:NAD(P)-binding protein [bacterium]